MVCSLCSRNLYIYTSVCTRITIPDLWVQSTPHKYSCLWMKRRQHMHSWQKWSKFVFVLHCLHSVRKWQCSAYTVHVAKWWMCVRMYGLLYVHWSDLYPHMRMTSSCGLLVAVMCSIITLANSCGLNGSCVSRIHSLPVGGSFIQNHGIPACAQQLTSWLHPLPSQRGFTRGLSQGTCIIGTYA